MHEAFAVVARDFKWRVRSTEHFDIYYYDETEPLVLAAAGILETAFARITKTLDIATTPAAWLPERARQRRRWERRPFFLFKALHPAAIPSGHRHGLRPAHDLRWRHIVCLSGASVLMLARKQGRLFLESLPIEALARRFGTPLYAYSRAEVLSRYEALRAAFASRDPLICYAMKANPNRAIVSLLARRGAGADIVSGGELLRALAAGVPACRIVFSGVGKSAEELALGLKHNVLAFNVESEGELAALEAAARRLRRRAPVSVRLNPDVDAKTHPHITTGLAHNKFGVAQPQALRLYEKAARSAWLKVVGIQCHIGSQITEVKPFALAAQAVAKTIVALKQRGITIELVDMGGGIGVHYGGCSERDLPLGRLAQALGTALPRRTRLLLEPGRFLVADAGVLIARLLYRKKTERQTFLIVDAAMNDLARPALYGAYHPIEPAVLRRGPLEPVDVVGPICESGDFLARCRCLPPMEPGDLLAVLKAGAYGFAMSSQYNSRPRAAEVLVSGAQARLIRRREGWEDLVRHEF